MSLVQVTGSPSRDNLKTNLETVVSSDRSSPLDKHIMSTGYSVKVGLNGFSGESMDHFVAYSPEVVLDLSQSAPYCQRSPVGPGMKTLPHTEYSGFGATPNEALAVALHTCRQDWPGIDIIPEHVLCQSGSRTSVT